MLLGKLHPPTLQTNGPAAETETETEKEPGTEIETEIETETGQ
jgi:hypothetical protein